MRYLPMTEPDRQAMLARIGAGSIDDLVVDVPEEARRDGLVDLPTRQGELEVERLLGALAAKNTPAGSVPFFVGIQGNFVTELGAWRGEDNLITVDVVSIHFFSLISV